MNYFTKAWYELCQKTSAHLLLVEDEKAGSYSEEFFQKLYNEKLAEFLDLWKRVASISNEPFEIDKKVNSFINPFYIIKNI